MRAIIILFLFTFLIQNSLSSSDFDVTITGIDTKLSYGCFPEHETLGPVFIFYLKMKVTGFPDLKDGTEWKIRLDDPYAYATCYIYASKESEQSTACTINALLFPLDRIKFPQTYSHYDQSYGWTVTNWDILVKEVVSLEPCYPKYLYSFTPSADTREEVVCNSKYNQVTIYGKLEKASTPSLRRLSTDAELKFNPYILIDGYFSQAKCEYSSLNEANSSEDALYCLVYGEQNFQFFQTAAVDSVTQSNVLVKASRQYNLISCSSSSSSFLKLGGILLASLLLL